MKKLIATIALMLVAAAACTVPTPSPNPVWSEVCVPADGFRSAIMATPVYVPESAWIDTNYIWEYHGMIPDAGVADATVTGFVAGQAKLLASIDAGHCLHMKPSPGLVYGLAFIPSPPINYPYTNGWPPGTPLPSA